MFKYLWKFKKDNSLLLVIIAFWVISNVMSSLSLTWMLDSLIKGSWDNFILWSIVDILCWGGYSLFQVWKDTLKEKLCQKEINLIRNDLLDSLITNSYAGSNNHSKGEYNSWLINDMNLLKDNGFMQFYNTVESITTVLFNAFAIIYFHWVLLVVSVIMTGLVYFVPKIFEKRIAEQTEIVSSDSTTALNRTSDYLSGFEVFFHNNQTSYFKKRILQDFTQLIKSKVSLSKTSSSANSLSMMSSIIAQVIIFITTGYLVVKGDITTGVIFSIANLTSCLFNYTRGAAYNIVTFKATIKLLEKYPKKAEKKYTSDRINFTETLTLRNVSVIFDNDNTIQYPNITIKKGDKIAIVGGSGSGKSTLIRLLTGELINYEGEIFLDNKNYKKISLKSLQEIFALIPQRPHIFKDTLLDNLTLGRSVDKTFFDNILKTSHVDTFIKGRLERKYEDNLSGGQKARVSIARELLGNKPIVIMDEGVSNLDKETAIDIEQKLLKSKDLTVIMITHHLYDENRELFNYIVDIGV
ncbi:TPA: ATP-binding cassette domain-containing protein [Streptococcus pyogenes]|uniref:ATP-binding cassette domain-containing protein n=1 Tax=Streptococcus pyogenes TaxID=1314 RepID=UPI000DA28A72|nr:ABC transporter ATP-binding protein [Streptococcus pyogenes]HER4512584.1 ABC transporter ATP-binding protein [Streptococcus pyogenes NGAS729]HER4517718.1 ABC transporter ATP-binding protein [Streptococcus pyogenes NGAS732]NSX77180.1 ABC transporter ATP-binding protein [Streptococcus pyogenes]NTS71816.1 ABC transporter ATP-binding protein [Streptococcus pyogenes]SQG23617.1 ATP-binding protein [Streptococcus pyogenes]